MYEVLGLNRVFGAGRPAEGGASDSRSLSAAMRVGFEKAIKGVIGGDAFSQ